MKPGELYKPVGFDCVLLCVGPDTFTVEAGTCPFTSSPLTEKIHFDPTPPMHRAWHWSDLVTEKHIQDTEREFREWKKSGDPIFQRIYGGARIWYDNLKTPDDLLLSFVLCDVCPTFGKFDSLKLNKTTYIYENNL